MAGRNTSVGNVAVETSAYIIYRETSAYLVVGEESAIMGEYDGSVPTVVAQACAYTAGENPNARNVVAVQSVSINALSTDVGIANPLLKKKRLQI